MKTGVVEFLVGMAAVWRVTHLFYAEDGPWDLLARLRRLAGDTIWGKMLDCFYCLSVWIALPFAAVLGTAWIDRLVLWPAFSGAAILLERVTSRSGKPAAAAEWYEESEEGEKQ